jgi:hypothetical protein
MQAATLYNTSQPFYNPTISSSPSSLSSPDLDMGGNSFTMPKIKRAFQHAHEVRFVSHK